MTAPRCQCTPTCRFRAAEGHPYALQHDPRPERQEARSALMAERGNRSGVVMADKRARRRIARRRNTDGLLATEAACRKELERVLGALDEATQGDVPKLRAQIEAVKLAHAILVEGVEEIMADLSAIFRLRPDVLAELKKDASDGLLGTLNRLCGDA